MASRKHYAYYIRGKQLAILQHDSNSGSGLNYSGGTHHTGGGQDGTTNPLDDIGPSGSSNWKSPTEAIADGIEIEYAYSPRYFIDETDDKNTGLDTYLSLDGLLKVIDSASNNYSTSPESLSDGSHIVLKKAGRWNGLHKVKAAGIGYVTLYTKYSGSASVEVAFEEAPELYYNVDALNDESDTIDLPEYLTKALVYYVKAKIAEDQMQLDEKEYLMKEFRRILEKHESSKIWGARQMGVGPHAIK